MQLVIRGAEAQRRFATVVSLVGALSLAVDASAADEDEGTDQDVGRPGIVAELDAIGGMALVQARVRGSVVRPIDGGTRSARLGFDQPAWSLMVGGQLLVGAAVTEGPLAPLTPRLSVQYLLGPKRQFDYDAQLDRYSFALTPSALSLMAGVETPIFGDAFLGAVDVGAIRVAGVRIDQDRVESSLGVGHTNLVLRAELSRHVPPQESFMGSFGIGAVAHVTGVLFYLKLGAVLCPSAGSEAEE